MSSDLESILKDKGHAVFSVSHRATVREAVDEMNQRGVGALLVMQDNKPCGIFTERDVLRRVVAAKVDVDTLRVGEVMTRELVAVSPSISPEEAMAVITQRRIRHLPVVRDERLLGMVSIGDLTRWAIRDREIKIEQLIDYISGKYPA